VRLCSSRCWRIRWPTGDEGRGDRPKRPMFSLLPRFTS